MASDDALVATPSQTVGPFFHCCLTKDEALGTMIGPRTRGERIDLRVRVLDGAGAAVPDAMVELWHADADGRYLAQPDDGPGAPGKSFRGWGRRATDCNGECEFKTIVPGPTTTVDGRDLASYINVCLFGRGMLRHVFTRIYFHGDPLLSSDPLFALVPVSRRDTLLARRVDAGQWTFDIRLQGDRETVLFDW